MKLAAFDLEIAKILEEGGVKMENEKLLSALRQWVKQTAVSIAADEKQAQMFDPEDKEYQAGRIARANQLQAFVSFMNGYMGDSVFMEQNELRRFLGWPEDKE